ncbi:MAG: glycosyltransferase [Synechococcus sp.]|nr:glycosyltransferase [Synechococcus sp.]
MSAHRPPVPLSPEPAAAPPRVLHVVESLGNGSVEAWLLRMAAHARLRRIPIDWTFYCQLPEAGAREPRARDLGLRVLRSPLPIHRKLGFARALHTTLATGGYQILHSHHDLLSGYYLAAGAGVPLRRRIVHVHNADEQVLTDHRLKRALLRPLLRQLSLRCADRIVANSHHCLDTFLAGCARRRDRDGIHRYGIDASPFLNAAADRLQWRRALGLPAAAPILLFLGRLTPEKNPLVAVEVLAALRRLRPDAIGVFVGSGSLSAAVERRLQELGLQDCSRMLGWRDDGAAIMAACDLFLLPRPEQPPEGFGMAVVEAQLAGLRLLLSRGVPPDPLLPTAVFRRLALAAGPERWAAAAAALLAQPAPDRAASLAAHRASAMDMDHALQQLLQLHA